ncbi:hypothetical protein PR202_ga14678 [Eleusine coracana subsp. coracana]|uniref:HIT domain-containing protein n=1 Tax=Eleusine coracana subsp. coracana TaxID=191504 RepID=A0AAV5CI77_ELECO|nr:hypothetical protein PR202_ga14678 [Eleusine coracana subsp. coracana]
MWSPNADCSRTRRFEQFIVACFIALYEITSNAQEQLHKANRNDQVANDGGMGRLANEKEQLESNLRICMGEDWSTLSVDDLSDLEQHLQSVLSKVRARKHELQTQLLDDLRRKVIVAHEQNHTEETVVDMEGMSSSTLSGSPFPMEPLPASSTVLQLWPQTDSGGVAGSGSSSPRGASSCKTRASPGCGLQLCFDKIIAKEIPSSIVYEDEKVLAFRDINPQAPVHILVIPKVRDGLTGLDKAEPRHAEILGQLLYAAKVVAEKEGLANGYRVVINNGAEGCQSVYHLHVHVLGGRQMKWPPG